MKAKKVILIIFTALAALYLLFIFTLVNFPFEPLLARIDGNLRESHGTGLDAGSVRYRYPLSLHLRDVRIERDEMVLTADELFIKIRLLNFGRRRTVELSAENIGARSALADASGIRMNAAAGLHLFRMMRGSVPAVEYVRVVLSGGEIERVLLAGFELSSMTLDTLQLFLEGDEKGFEVQRGILKADVARVELDGRADPDGLDLKMAVVLTDLFYRKFGELKTIVDSAFEDGKLTLEIKGTIDKPQTRIVK